MRHLFRLEKRHDPLASPAAFSARLRLNGIWATGVIVVSMIVGMAGYMAFENMSVVDAFVNAAMILSGMGPVTPLTTTGGKIFAAVYAIASGLLLLAVAGLILAPVYHRILHQFHVEEQPEPENQAKRAPAKTGRKPRK